jgi:hypothetical protein
MFYAIVIFAIIGVIALIAFVVFGIRRIVRKITQRHEAEDMKREALEIKRIRSAVAEELRNKRPTDDDVADSGTFYARLMADITALEKTTDERLNDMDGLLGNVVVALKQMRQEIRMMGRMNRKGRAGRLIELSEPADDEEAEEAN